MNRNEKIENRLREEVESSVPDVFDKILDSVDRKEDAPSSSVVYLDRSKKKNKKPVIKALSAIAAVLAVVLIGSYSWMLAGNNATFDIEFDVNPGVILEVNKNQRVTDVTTLNSDAEIVLDGMDLKGSNLDVAVNALMFSIIKNGYIDEMTNSVLVTVSDKNSVGTDITNLITQQISDTFAESSIEGSVLVQSAASTQQVEQLAQQYGITVGKATLITHLVESGKTAFTYEQLSKLSINELNILMNEKDASDDILIIGQASRKAYIGEEAAKQIAFAAANVAAADVRYSDCSLDLDDGMLVYEVNFVVSGAVYECEVDALTGELLDCEIETVSETEQTQQTTVAPTVSFKTKEEVKQSILTLLSLEASDCKNFEIELDYDDGVAKYEVEFIADGKKFEYDINAVDGTVLSFSSKTVPAVTEPTTQPVTEPAVQATTEQPATQVPSTAQQETESSTTAPTSNGSSGLGNLIGRAKAKEIATNHAGVPSDIKAEIEFDYDHGIIYSVEFTYNNIEYEYEIDATSGEIVEIEKEADD